MADDLFEFENYLYTLEEEDIDDVIVAIHPATTAALRFNQKLSLTEQVAIENLDEILKYAPTTKKDMVLFKAYEGAEEFRKGGKLEDAGFTTGTTKQLSGGPGQVVLAIYVPKGTKALYMEEDSWVLPRGLTMTVRGADNGPLEARIV